MDTPAPHFLLSFVAEFLSFCVFSGSYNSPGWLLKNLFCYPNGGTTAQICCFSLSTDPDLISECKPFTRAHSYCHTQEHAQKASLRVEKGMDLALGELEMPVSLTEESSDEVLSEAYG